MIVGIVTNLGCFWCYECAKENGIYPDELDDLSEPEYPCTVDDVSGDTDEPCDLCGKYVGR